MRPTQIRLAKRPEGEPGDEAFAVTHDGWQTHAVSDGRALRRLDPSSAPVSTALGVLGMPGFTAYAGLLEIGRPRAGETVVVAAATGPVGSAVGQIARITGARAVGIAGGPEKCRALSEDFGFDAAVDHRSETFAGDLAAAVPDGVDVYFENVGGEVAREVFRHLNLYGFMGLVLRRSLTVRGFIQGEFTASHGADFERDMSAWVADGSVRYREDVVEGLENAPEAFRGLLAGRNFGKLLVRVGDDPTLP